MKGASAQEAKATAATVDINILFINFIRSNYMSQYKSHEYRKKSELF